MGRRLPGGLQICPQGKLRFLCFFVESSPGHRLVPGFGRRGPIVVGADRRTVHGAGMAMANQLSIIGLDSRGWHVPPTFSADNAVVCRSERA